MAFPSVFATDSTSLTTASTTQGLNTNLGTDAETTLHLMAVRIAVAGAIGWPAGWTELVESAADGSDDVFAMAWHKPAPGDPATIDITCGNGKGSAVGWGIAGSADPTVTPPVISTVGTGSGTTPNPPNLNPDSSTVRDFLWVAVASSEGEQSTSPTYPANYADGQRSEGSGTAGAVTTNTRVYGAARQNAVGQEDPGTFTISVSDDWMAVTVAVFPAVVAPARVIVPKRELVVIQQSINRASRW